jgi:hypothetical protein
VLAFPLLLRVHHERGVERRFDLLHLARVNTRPMVE